MPGDAAGPAGARPRVGLTLPSFVDDPEVVIGVARAAEDAGLDGVFAFDHLFRLAPDGRRRPALSMEVVLGAVAAETSRITVGSLVARATTRPPATLASVLDTVHRVAPGRFVAGVGSGDHESDPEQEAFGLAPERVATRVAALEATVRALEGRGYPVWVGGRAPHILGLAAAAADGWNGWGLGLEAFAARVGELARASAAAGRSGEVVATWGGLVELREDRDDPRPDVLSGSRARVADALRRYAEAGAAWLVLGPVDSADPANVDVLASDVLPRLTR